MESFYLSFCICYFTLVAKCCLNFFNKFVSILGIIFFFHLVNLFLHIYISAISSLNQANTAVILLFIVITLLFLRNKHIFLHQFSNFVSLLSSHPGSKTIFLSIIIYSNTANASADTVDIISSNISGLVILFLSKTYSLVIFNNLSISSSTSISVF